MIKVGDVVKSLIHNDREFVVLEVSGDGTQFQIFLNGSGAWFSTDNPSFQTVFSRYETENRLTHLERMTGYKHREPKDDEYAIQRLIISFEDVIDKIDSRSLQRLVREVDEGTLTGVLYSCDTKERVENFRKSVSKNHFERLLNNIKDGYVSHPQSCADKFIHVCRQLEEMGEIVVCRSDEYIPVFPEPKPETPEEKEARIKASNERWERYMKEAEERGKRKQEEVQTWLKKVGLA